MVTIKDGGGSNNMEYVSGGTCLQLYSTGSSRSYYVSVPDGYYISQMAFTATLGSGLTVTIADNDEYAFTSDVEDVTTLDVNAQEVHILLTGSGQWLAFSSLSVTVVKGNAPDATYLDDIVGKVVSSVATEATTIGNISEDAWYMLYNCRTNNGETVATPLYDTGTEIYRAATADANPVSVGDKAESAAKYLVRFIQNTEFTSADENVSSSDTNNKVYQLQFASARYWADMSDYTSGSVYTSSTSIGNYNVYTVDENDTWIYLNVYDMGYCINNNGAGSNVCLYNNGYHSGENINEEWTLYKVELADAEDDNTVEVDWTMTTAGWGTLILPFDADVPTSMAAYTCSSLDGEELVLTEASSIAKNTPYIVEYTGEDELTEDISCAFSGTPDDFYYTLVKQEGEYLVGTLKDIYVPKWDTSVTDYVLQKQNDYVAFYYVASDEISLTAYHCYLSVPASSDVKAFFSFPSSSADTETAISGIEDGAAAGSAMYDLSGRQVSSPRKGIYIKGGKKVIIK